MLMKTASPSLAEQLSARFAERICSPWLAPGVRLPSVGLCAEQQGVSVFTVVAAYDQAQAQGPFGGVETGVDTHALAQCLLDEDCLIAPRRAVSCPAQVLYPDAHQLCHDARCSVLERVRAAAQ